MSSTADLNFETIFSKDGKYHIMLIYLVKDDGYYGGGYYADYFKLMGAVGGESFDKMIDEAYESLEMSIEDEDYLPFDIKKIKEFVVFDPVECHNEKELYEAFDLRKKGTSYEEINKAILQ